MKPRGFHSNPAVRWVSLQGGTQQLLEDLLFVDRRGWAYTVPAGFVTDYASIPRAFWGILSPYGNGKFAAIVHDYLYWLRGDAPYNATRADADLVFLDGMEWLGVGWMARHTMYQAVRIFGGIGWSKPQEPKVDINLKPQ